MSTHTLVVEGEIVVEDGVEISDDLEFRVECSGADETCYAWWPCDACGSLTDEQAETLERTERLHGEDHRQFDGVWMTLTGDCYVASHDLVSEAAWETGIDEAGRYAVDWDAPDGTDLLLAPIEESK